MNIKGKDGSFFHNNFVKRRESDNNTIIHNGKDSVTCRLNGYAIIPFEEYVALAKDTSINLSEFMEKVNKTNCDLTKVDAE